MKKITKQAVLDILVDNEPLADHIVGVVYDLNKTEGGILTTAKLKGILKATSDLDEIADRILAQVNPPQKTTREKRSDVKFTGKKRSRVKYAGRKKDEVWRELFNLLVDKETIEILAGISLAIVKNQRPDLLIPDIVWTPHMKDILEKLSVAGKIFDAKLERAKKTNDTGFLNRVATVFGEHTRYFIPEQTKGKGRTFTDESLLLQWKRFLRYYGVDPRIKDLPENLSTYTKDKETAICFFAFFYHSILFRAFEIEEHFDKLIKKSKIEKAKTYLEKEGLTVLDLLQN